MPVILYVRQASRLAEDPEEPQGDAGRRWREGRSATALGLLPNVTSRQTPQGEDMATLPDSTGADGLSGLSASCFVRQAGETQPRPAAVSRSQITGSKLPPV